MTIGKRIKELRIESGLTQEALASKIGVSFQAVSKWENGRSQPDLGTLSLLSKTLNVSIDYLINGQDFSPVPVPIQDEVVEFFVSLIGPCEMPESVVDELHSFARTYSVEKCQIAIRTAYNRYGTKYDGFPEIQIREMMKKLGGILYRNSLDPVSRRIYSIVSFLEKRLDYKNPNSARRLRNSIRRLLEEEKAGTNCNETEIDIVNRINERHLEPAELMSAAIYSVENEIERLKAEQVREQVRLIKEEREKKAGDIIANKIARGYFGLPEGSSEELKSEIGKLNDLMRKGDFAPMPTIMKEAVSTLSFEMVSYSHRVVFDEALKNARIDRDFDYLKPRLYDLLGRDLGKSCYIEITSFLVMLDDIEAGKKNLGVETIKAFEHILERLSKKRNRLKKWSENETGVIVC